MSTDTGFSLATYPALRGVDHRQSEAQGHARGHAAGYAAGLRAAAEDTRAVHLRLQAEHDALQELRQAELDRAVAVLGAAVEALNATAMPIVANAQNVLAASALELTEAIVGHELCDEAGSARAALARATAQVGHVVKPLVRMNPDDLALLADELLVHAEITFVPDPLLARGDAIAEFPDGFLDARIGTALQRAKSALLPGVR